MTREDRQHALEYTFYMVLEQGLSLGKGRCETLKTPYLEKLSLAWSELPGSYVDQDFESCEKIFAEEIEPMLSVPFCEHSRIVITPKDDSVQSDIAVYAGESQLIINLTLSKAEGVKCTKTIVEH